MNYLGELAAIGSALAFAVNSGLFTAAGRRVGAGVVNRTRLLFAAFFAIISHWIFLGTPWPWDAEPEHWLWLGLSGLAGFVLGDAFLFQAFVWVGARISMLMMSLTPVIAALTAWLFLGESLTFWQIAGIALTLGGIAWVLWEGNGSQAAQDPNYVKGILFGLGGAIGQALGIVLAKNGMQGDISPLSGNFIRLFTATALMWAYTLFKRQGQDTFSRLAGEGRALCSTAGGAFVGPFLGVSLSLFALQNASVGVISTLMALSPVFLLPIGYFWFKERFGWRAVAGTLLAMAGVALLILL